MHIQNCFSVLDLMIETEVNVVRIIELIINLLVYTFINLNLQWNLSNSNTLGTKIVVLISDMSRRIICIDLKLRLGQVS